MERAVDEDHLDMKGAAGTPVPVKETDTDERAQRARLSKVVLHDDDEHTYDYVVEMLVHCCSLSRESAFRCAVEVDVRGVTTVFYGTSEECGRRRDKIHAYGADPHLPRSRGSMKAEVQFR